MVVLLFCAEKTTNDCYKASVPGASNKLGEWLSYWVRDFLDGLAQQWEVAKKTEFGKKVV